MTSRDERGLDRAEEAFSALSAGAGRTAGGPRSDPPAGRGPWRAVSVALLLLLLGLVIAGLAVRSRAAARRRGRVAAAATAVERGARADSLPTAIAGLGAALRELADVPGADAAVGRLVRSAATAIRERAGYLDETRARSVRLARVESALAAILDGDPVAARERLSGADDPEAAATGELADRLEALDRAVSATGREREDALATLAARWPLDAVSILRAGEAAERERVGEVDAAVAAAKTALDRGDVSRARDEIERAARSAGLPPLLPLFDRAVRSGLSAAADAAEKGGEPGRAAALYRALASLGGPPDASERAGRLETEVARLRLASFLRRAADEAVSNRDFAGSATYLAALGRVTGVDVTAARDAARGAALLDHARRLRTAGDAAAALALAREAADLGSGPAKAFAAEIAAGLEERRRDRDAAARIEAARAALAEGEAEFAARRVAGLDVPDDLRRGIETARDAARERARRRELRTGDLGAALAPRSGSAAPGAGELLAAAADVLGTDPARAAALAARVLEAAPENPVALALRAVALARTDRAPDAPAVWARLRDLALVKAPPPAPVKKEPAPEEKEPPAPAGDGGK